MARPLRRPVRGPIGFAVRDSTGRGCAYEIDEKSAEAVVFGSSSPLRISALGVLPAHFVVLPHDGVLVAASASARTPAILNGSPLPTSWTVLAVPSRIRIGGAAVDFFYIRDRESGTVLIDLDVETTIADPGRDEPTPAMAPSPLPSPSPSPLKPRVSAGGSGPTRVDPTGPHKRFTTPVRTVPALRAMRPAPLGPIAKPPVTTRNVIIAAFVYLRQSWKRASMSTCVLLGVVAVLLVFLIAR